MSSVVLSGPLRNWRETFVRWGAELRKIPFIFLDDFYWSDWQPLYPTTAGGMVLTNVNTVRARYRTLGGSLVISACVVCDLTVFADTQIIFTLPVNVKDNQALACTVGDGVTVTYMAGGAFTQAGNQVGVYRGSGAAWTLGTARSFRISGELELETRQDRKAA